jgi:hypothetical protein
LSHHYGRRSALPFTDDGFFDHIRRAGRARETLALARGRGGFVVEPRTAAVVVLAPAISALDADGLSFVVGGDDRVNAVGLAGAAVVLN